MATPDSAVAVIEQSVEASVVEWNLDSFPEDKFNRLLPTQTIAMPTDLLRPVVQVVKLSPNPADGDVYHSDDMAADHSAPTKVGLRKLAMAAGISIVDEKRTDDGTDPDVIEVTALAEMLLPTGIRIHAPGIKRIDLNAKKWSSKDPDKHRAKFRGFHLENVASGAENRAIRALTSLRGSYPTTTFNKPFAVVSYAPNMNHPEVRQRYLDAIAPVAAQLYGSQSNGAKQIGPGAAVVNAPEAPEEDPAPATPTVLPGEKLAAAAAPEEPDWLKAPKPDFTTQLRDSAAAVEDGDALATGDELAPLRDIFAGYGGFASPGFLALWPGDDGSKPSKGQAHAIATVHDSMGHDAFERSWRGLVDGVKAVAS